MGFIFPHKVKVLKKEYIKQDIIRIFIEKPFGYTYKIGQTIDLSINKPEFALEVASFTLMSNENQSYLEIIVKVYPDCKEISNGLSLIAIDDCLLISKAWDYFKYNGPGVFIVDGMYITQILFVFKQLYVNEVSIKNHNLILLNETREDIVFGKELRRLLGNNYIDVITTSEAVKKINTDLLIENLNKDFYVLGSFNFKNDINILLNNLGVKRKKIQCLYEA